MGDLKDFLARWHEKGSGRWDRELSFHLKVSTPYGNMTLRPHDLDVSTPAIVPEEALTGDGSGIRLPATQPGRPK